MDTPWAILSIGSNLGDPLRNCRLGIEGLCADGSVHLEHLSPFYWTEPIGFTKQEWFLNAALKVRTALSPRALLTKLKTVQRFLGREEGGVRFGPRILDLDIIFYQEMVVESPDLIIPHPRMHKRRFVLQPICDIDPDIRHPVLGVTMDSLLNQIDRNKQKIRPCYCDLSLSSF